MKWFLIAGGLMWSLSAQANAQGLFWSLPQDGTSIRYEGTLTQVVKQADAPQDLTIEFRRIVTIKSVGTENAEYQGQDQPCRWLEIKSETGKAAEAVLEEGPGGLRIYKLLVPEVVVQGQVNETAADGRKIHIAFLPIAKGFRKIGDEAAVPIESGVFEIYPLISLLRYYPELTSAEAARNLQVPAGNFESTLYQGTMVAESASRRSTNSGEVERSDKVPFGVVKWNVRIVVETKATTDARADFKELLTVTEELEAVAVGEAAESELTEK